MTPEAELARQIALKILLSYLEDIEWLSICEMTSDVLEAKGFDLPPREEADFYHTVDAWISKARVEITFEENADATS